MLTLTLTDNFEIAWSVHAQIGNLLPTGTFRNHRVQNTKPIFFTATLAPLWGGSRRDNSFCSYKELSC